MSRSQPHDIGSLLSSLHLEDGTQIHIFAEGFEGIMKVPCPNNCSSEQWQETSGHDDRFLQSENANHKDQESNNAPDKTDERDRPGLTLRFIWFVEHYGARKTLSSAENAGEDHSPNNSLYLYTTYAIPK